MKIGILSDTHGRAAITAAAVARLREHGARYLIHCGDIGSVEVLRQMACMPSLAVWGNCDFDRADLARAAAIAGIGFAGAVGQIELAGKIIAVLHGDDQRAKERIFTENAVDYLFQGHTHVPLDQRRGRVRHINPGALHRANPRTVALVDLATDTLEWLEVEPK